MPWCSAMSVLGIYIRMWSAWSSFGLVVFHHELLHRDLHHWHELLCAHGGHQGVPETFVDMIFSLAFLAWHSLEVRVLHVPPMLAIMYSPDWERYPTKIPSLPHSSSVPLLFPLSCSTSTPASSHPPTSSHLGEPFADRVSA